MRAFLLVRLEDPTGISGTGVVAEGVQFLNGKVVVEWMAGDHHSTVVWDSIESVTAINGHGGKTRIMWADEEHREFSNYRDAKTGRYVTEGYANSNPSTTVKETYDENTLDKALRAAQKVTGNNNEVASDVIREMQNSGILFRERTNE